MTTTADLAALLAAATPGPWFQGKNNPDRVSARGAYLADCDPNHLRHPRCEANAALIALAPTLAAEVLAQRAKLIEAEKALAKIVDAAFYDNGDVTYDCNAMSMAYFAARGALAKIREGL